MGCSNNLTKGINSACDTSIGGIKKILIADWKEGALGEKAATGETYSLSTVATSTAVTWYEFSVRKAQSQLTNTVTIDDATGSNFVQTDLALTFTKQEAVKRVALAALLKSEVMALILDANGNIQLLGETEPVQATAAGGQTGAARSDANNYTITLSDFNPEFPKFITALPTNISNG